MRAARLAVVPAALALVLAGGASAGVVQVNWNEQAKVKAKPAIAFHVRALADKTKGKVSGWAVTASFTNRTSKPLRISRNQFGLALFKNAKATNPKDGTLMPALAFKPDLPAVLAPGKTWRGTFAGYGKPPEGAYVRVLFGWFSGPAVGGSGFNWLSDHVQRWCSGHCSTYGA
jgi:hypothetical protein